MDITTLFAKTSKRLSLEFQESSHISHNGGKGGTREGILIDFLRKDKLPKRFGVGTGEVITFCSEVSRQCDIIIYDEIDGVSLLTNDYHSIYPIECVAGIIEVKSTLTKEELHDGLGKIKWLKTIAPSISAIQQFGQYTITHPKAKPFGIIFAFDSKTSLETLLSNYKDWLGTENSHTTTKPELIVVLGKGIIVNTRDFNGVEIAGPHLLEKTTETLFEFYKILLALCAKFKPGDITLDLYGKGYRRDGKYFTRKKGDLINKDYPGKVGHLTEKSLECIVNWCEKHGKISYADFMLKHFNSVPAPGVEEFFKGDLYLYNPENYQPLHEMGISIFDTIKPNTDATLPPNTTMSMNIEINGKSYMIPMDYLAQLEVVYQ